MSFFSHRLGIRQVVKGSGRAGWMTLLSLVVPLVACAGNADAAADRSSDEELLRVGSPDGVVEAVITRANVHATAPFVYRLFIVPTAGAVPVERDHELLRADEVTNLCLRWDGTQLLTVAYDEARIFHFANFWNSREVDDFRYTVELRLKAAAEESSLAEALPGSADGACVPPSGPSAP